MVNFASIAASVLLASYASAIAIPETENRACRPRGPLRRFNATYDDLVFNDGAASPINTYKQLKYSKEFNVEQYDGFIHPTSGTQSAIVYGGTLPARISTISPRDSFNLKSFSYACITSFPPKDCTIKIRAQNVDGVTWASNTFVYPAVDPRGPFLMKTFTVDPRYYSDLAYVEFESALTEDDVEGNVQTALNIDDLVYEKRNCK